MGNTTAPDRELHLTLAERYELIHLLPDHGDFVTLTRVKNLTTVLELAEGDTIQTEISRKFTHGSLEAMVCGAGFAIERHYEARAPAFSLVLARPM